MSLFEEMLREVLRRHDSAREADAQAEQARFEKLQHDIMMRARQEAVPAPQPKERRRFLPHYVYNLRNIWPKLSFDPEMQLAYGVIVLILGLWVGQSLVPAQGKAYTNYSVKGQKISVMAMAEPWEGWIEGGE